MEMGIAFVIMKVCVFTYVLFFRMGRAEGFAGWAVGGRIP